MNTPLRSLCVVCLTWIWWAGGVTGNNSSRAEEEAISCTFSARPDKVRFGEPGETVKLIRLTATESGWKLVLPAGEARGWFELPVSLPVRLLNLTQRLELRLQDSQSALHWDKLRLRDAQGRDFILGVKLETAGQAVPLPATLKPAAAIPSGPAEPVWPMRVVGLMFSFSPGGTDREITFLELIATGLPAATLPDFPAGLGQAFEPGEPFRLFLPSAAKAATAWQVVDYDGQRLAQGQIQPYAETVELAGLPKPGFYRVLYEADGRTLGASGLIVNRRVPAAERSPQTMIVPAVTRFATDDMVKAECNLLTRTSVGSIRSYHFWWLAEAEKGQWRRTRWDEIHRLYQEAGLKIHLTFCGAVPARAMPAGRSGCYFPASFREYHDYVCRLLRETPPNLWLYEVWNEPDIMGNMTGARAATLAKVVALAVRQTRPELLLTTPSPATSSLENWYAEMMANGLEDYVDAFAFHKHTQVALLEAAEARASAEKELQGTFEETLNPEKNRAGHAQLEDTFEVFRDHYSRYARHAQGLPGINTESGIMMPRSEAKGWTGEQRQAEAIPVVLASSLHFGAQYHSYYVLKDWGDGPWWNLLNGPEFKWTLGDLSPRAGLWSLSVVAELLRTAEPQGRLELAGAPSARVLFFASRSPEVGERTVVVCWDQYNQRTPLPSALMAGRVIDHQGREIEAAAEKVVAWPPRYVLLPAGAGAALPLIREALFPAPRPTVSRPCPIVLDLKVPEVNYTIRPISGIRLDSPQQELPLTIYNFSDRDTRVRLQAQPRSGTLSFASEEVSIPAQGECQTLIRFTAGQDFVSLANAFGSGLTQEISGESDAGRAKLAFNLYPSATLLPVVRSQELGMNRPENWYQLPHDTGQAEFVNRAGSLDVRTNYAPEMRNKSDKILYIRYRLADPLPAWADFQALSFQLEVKEGIGLFQLGLANGLRGKAEKLTCFRFGKFAAGDKLKVVVPMDQLQGKLEWKEVHELHLGVAMIATPQLEFSLSDLKCVSWKKE